jgi:DNA polymerase elongation subunit (family B)
MTFYTNVSQIGNKIYHKWIDDKGKLHEEFTDSHADLFVKTNDETPYKTPSGESVGKIEFSSIRDAKDFIEEHADISNMEIYGNQNWWAQFISKNYPGEIQWDMSKIKIANIDIETRVGTEGFPEPSIAPNEITAITVEINGKYHVFGSKEYTKKLPKHIQHENFLTESELLMAFCSWWRKQNFDAVTGWNIDSFDIPYIINRIKRILGDEFVNWLSPASKYTKKCINTIESRYGATNVIHGLAILDYLKMYKFYTFKMREKYSLDYIGYVELGERKLDYSEVQHTYQLLEDSNNVNIDWNKEPGEMEEFVRWCRMRELIKKEKMNRS